MCFRGGRWEESLGVLGGGGGGGGLAAGGSSAVGGGEGTDFYWNGTGGGRFFSKVRCSLERAERGALVECRSISGSGGGQVEGGIEGGGVVGGLVPGDVAEGFAGR